MKAIKGRYVGGVGGGVAYIIYAQGLGFGVLSLSIYIYTYDTSTSLYPGLQG